MTVDELKVKYPLNTTIVGSFYCEIIADDERGATSREEAKEIMLNPPEHCFTWIEKTNLQEYYIIWLWWKPIVGYTEINHQVGFLVEDDDTELYEFVTLKDNYIYSTTDEAANLFNDFPNVYSTWDAVEAAIMKEKTM